MIGGLEQQPDPRMMGGPCAGDAAGVDGVVIQHHVNRADTAWVVALNRFQETQVEIGVLGLAFGIENGTSIRIECAGQVALTILAWGWNGNLLATSRPE